MSIYVQTEDTECGRRLLETCQECHGRGGFGSVPSEDGTGSDPCSVAEECERCAGLGEVPVEAGGLVCGDPLCGLCMTILDDLEGRA